MSQVVARLTRAMRRTNAARSLVAAITVVGVAACSGAKDAGSNAAANQQGSAKKTLTIAMIGKSSTNPVFLSGRTGAEAAAKELTDSTGIQVKIDWLTPPSEDATLQAQRIAQAVNSGDDAVLLSASEAAKVTGAIDQAVARGVPVMTFDSDVPGSKRFSFYGGDDEAMGRQVVAELAKQMGGKGKIAILGGNQNAPNLQKRVKGAKDEAAKYPGITVVNTFYHTETPQDAAAEVLRGRRVTTRTLIVPGSMQVKKAAEAEGLDEVFRAAGAEWRQAGCSMCLGMNPDTLSPGERSASTSNRNFEGRQGKGGRTHLVSPQVAAATAVTGYLTAPADLA